MTVRQEGWLHNAWCMALGEARLPAGAIRAGAETGSYTVLADATTFHPPTLRANPPTCTAVDTADSIKM